MKIGSKLKAAIALILVCLLILGVLLITKQNKTYSVAFYDEEDKIFMSVSYDAVLNLPPNPEKNGYTFNGWFFDKEFEDALTVDSFKEKIDGIKNVNYKAAVNYIRSIFNNQKTYHNVYAKWIKVHTHDLVRSYVIKEATCEEEGLEFVLCKDETCDYTAEIAIPKVEYVFVKITKISPDCQTDGIKLYECPHCKKTKEVVYRAEHAYVTETIKKATCENIGRQKTYCKTDKCGEYEEKDVPKTGHNYVKNMLLSVDPTCTTEGTLIEECHNVGCEKTTKTTTLPIIPHKMVLDKETSKAPDCENDGYNIFLCGVCGETEQITVPKLGHNIITITIKPTCTEKGSITKKCNREDCSYVQSVEELDIVPHDLIGKWEYTENKQNLQKKCKNGEHYQYFDLLDNDFVNGFEINDGSLSENANNPFIMALENGELVIKGLKEAYLNSDLVIIDAFGMNIKICKDAFIGTKLEKIIILNYAEVIVESGAITNSSIELISL